MKNDRSNWTGSRIRKVFPLGRAEIRRTVFLPLPWLSKALSLYTLRPFCDHLQEILSPTEKRLEKLGHTELSEKLRTQRRLKNVVRAWLTFQPFDEEFSNGHIVLCSHGLRKSGRMSRMPPRLCFRSVIGQFSILFLPKGVSVQLLSKLYHAAYFGARGYIFGFPPTVTESRVRPPQTTPKFCPSPRDIVSCFRTVGTCCLMSTHDRCLKKKSFVFDALMV